MPTKYLYYSHFYNPIPPYFPNSLISLKKNIKLTLLEHPLRKTKNKKIASFEFIVEPPTFPASLFFISLNCTVLGCSEEHFYLLYFRLLFWPVLHQRILYYTVLQFTAPSYSRFGRGDKSTQAHPVGLLLFLQSKVYPSRIMWKLGQ